MGYVYPPPYFLGRHGHSFRVHNCGFSHAAEFGIPLGEERLKRNLHKFIEMVRDGVADKRDRLFRMSVSAAEGLRNNRVNHFQREQISGGNF